MSSVLNEEMNQEAQTDWLLHYADQSVIDALQSASISRQHAQLLAVLSPERQASTLKALLGLQALPGVMDVARSIESKARPLASFPFSASETAPCRKCIHNSDVNSIIFQTHIGPGLCTNGACAQSLWTKYAQDVADTMPSKYRVIRVEPVLTGTRISADAESVGADQFAKCESTCESFGASILGSATKGISQCHDVCFNPTCLAEKMAEARAAQLEATRDKFWRTGLQRYVLEADRGLNRVLMLCMMAGGWQTSADFGEMVFKRKVDPSQAFAMANGDIPLEALTDGLHEVAVNLVIDAPIHQVRDLLKVLHVPLGQYFPMQKSFLEHLDFDGIAGIAKELGVEESETMVMARQVSSTEYAKAVAQAIPDKALIGYIPPQLRP